MSSSEDLRIVALVASPGPKVGTVRLADGTIQNVPEGWALLLPGDPGLTRRVKADGPTWTIQERRGRKIFSRGVWAPADRIEAIRAELEKERSGPAYTKRRVAAKVRREKEQSAYVEDFRGAVLAFLDFAPIHAVLGERLAAAVASHATPVGSGTVARTERIPIEDRAAAAVIAWLRHQTTAYDEMSIARIRGERREVRRMLAKESHRLLDRYRRGEEVPSGACPLSRALDGGPAD